MLLGVSRYENMPPLPTVATNLSRLREALTDKEIWGVPADRCVTVDDPSTSGGLIDPVIEAASRARDLLIVYYAGHGFVDGHGALHLTVVGSRDGARHTAVPYDWLRDALLEHTRARRRLIILDCCYSGRAIGDMSGPVTSLRTAADVEGSYLLTSAAANVKALAPEKEECTAFTGELVRVLRDGVPGEEGAPTAPYLTLDVIYRQVRDTLQGKGRPKPQQQDRGQIGQLPFVRNVARPTPSSGPSSRWRRCGVVVTVAAALATAATSPLWWPGGDGGTNDVCSPRASLIGYSDALDKTAFQGREVAGLSSLALTGSSGGSAEVLSLADQSPPMLYRLSLGRPGLPPKPRVTAVTQLHGPKGTPYGSHDFDGEALALEKGGKTVLVASETRPSVGRYDLATGALLDELPVPPAFLPSPRGEAVPNRIFEAMALTPDGRHLYVGLEKALGRDGSHQGRERIRVLRYRATPGGPHPYALDGQLAYEAGSGMQLADLVPVGDGERFLALERGFTSEQGNSVHVHEVSFARLRDVTGTPSLESAPASDIAPKRRLVDLGRCPASGAPAKQPQSNPLLDNAEGISLGPPLTEGAYAGRRPLYLITDDNALPQQITRVYALAVTGL